MKTKERTPSVAFKQANDAWNDALDLKLKQIGSTNHVVLKEDSLWLKIYSSIKDNDPKKLQGLLDIFEKREARGVPTPSFNDLSPPQEFASLDPHARRGLKVSGEWPLSWVKPVDRAAFMESLLDSNHVLLPQALEALPRMLHHQISLRTPFTPEREVVFKGVYSVVKSRAENDDGSKVQAACRDTLRRVELFKKSYGTAVGHTYAEAAFASTHPA